MERNIYNCRSHLKPPIEEEVWRIIDGEIIYLLLQRYEFDSEEEWLKYKIKINK